ncbi:hypothetical protein BayCH28_08685 [Mycolicibacterium sp. CH28]|uniref:hypothetical protein n=1 Tax=Mycolicibacterium sp. CH28 TaxID=2512237 RepID=UPI0010817B31|nr:hypothetical protein [Mycolicibacterium sp. CH28]TGD87883.1 hypothetical protein BayCH28_08685 [Mycolicibacterium sp. CH28]
MPGIADIALGAAPIAGGALLGIAAGTMKGPDIRGMIKSDLELLDKLPPEDVELRAALKASIDRRIQDVIVSTEKSRELLDVAASYKGNWRDIVLFVCAVLFTVVWWNIPHSRTNWLPTFIFLILLSVVVFFYATRGLIRALRGVSKKDSPR